MIGHSMFNKTLTALVLVAILSACKPAPTPVAILSTPQETRKQIATSHAALTLVHVWATWCQPCREEFPELLKVYDAYRKDGLDLKLVSADNPDDLETVNTFLREQDSPVDSLVSTDLDENFIELFSPKWSGALPASFFFDSNGKLVAEWEGKRSYEEYASTIEQLLKP